MAEAPGGKDVRQQGVRPCRRCGGTGKIRREACKTCAGGGRVLVTVVGSRYEVVPAVEMPSKIDGVPVQVGDCLAGPGPDGGIYVVTAVRK